MFDQPQNSEKLEHLRRMQKAINTGLTNLEISQQTRGRSPQDIISRAVFGSAKKRATFLPGRWRWRRKT